MGVEAAFILAAGRGERLRPLTDFHPKPLIKIKTKPILEYVLDNLRPLGLKRVVLNAWHFADQIEAFADEARSKFPFEILVSTESELLGTGGGLKKALPLVGKAPFLMMNGDCIWKGDLQLWMKKIPSNIEASWVLIEPQAEQTLIGFDGGELCQIGELWKSREPSHRGCFSGIQLISRIFDESLPAKGCIIRDYWIPRLQKSAKLGVEMDLLSAWEDLGTPERLRVFEGS